MPAQPTPPPAGDDRDPAAVATSVTPGFEERLHDFWAKYSQVILGVCVAILLVIVGRHAWDWLQERRAAAQAEAYASATNEAELRAFVAEHGGSELGGVAQLRLADEAYAAGRWADAVTGYQQAQSALGSTPLAGRARLGAAVAQLKQDSAGPGRAALRDVSADNGLATAIRAEAGYHLASLAAAESNAEEVGRLVELVSAIDPDGLWAQRAMMLRATIAGAAPATPAADASTITFPVPGN